jgi:hemoglobin-like flavoprotein
MTPEQQELVRESWRRFEPTLREAGARFYERLFALDPVLERLFAGVDMAEQEQKLMAMLAQIVQVIDQPDHLVGPVAGLGRRHVHYGVKDRDYESVGAALLWTLEEALGSAFTPDVRAAWSEAYLVVATIMRRAAARELITGEIPAFRPGPS